VERVIVWVQKLPKLSQKEVLVLLALQMDVHVTQQGQETCLDHPLLHLLKVHGLPRYVELSNALAADTHLKYLWETHQSDDEFKAQGVDLLSLLARISLPRGALQSHINYRLDGVQWPTCLEEVFFEVNVFLDYQ
jgi:hypothetical protein